LVNILSLVALAGAILMLMVSDQDRSVGRTLRFREASQAAVLARAGELSAAVALRKDALEAPEADHQREPWAKVIEREASIQGGTFSLTVTDAQGRFNLNALGGALPGAELAAIAGALQLTPEAIERISASIRERGNLVRLEQLREFGLDEAALRRLAPFVTTLPGASTVNLNSASEELIAFLTGNDAAARMLVSQRERAGFLTPGDLAALNVALPAGAGFTSNYFWVRTTVTIGDTAQTLISLLRRGIRDGRPEVVTLGRWRGAEAPDALPPF
jgi:general secretion pathway protein K